MTTCKYFFYLDLYLCFASKDAAKTFSNIFLKGEKKFLLKSNKKFLDQKLVFRLRKLDHYCKVENLFIENYFNYRKYLTIVI